MLVAQRRRAPARRAAAARRGVRRAPTRAWVVGRGATSARCCTRSTSGGSTRSTPACRRAPVLARGAGAARRSTLAALAWLRRARWRAEARARMKTLTVVVLNWNGLADTRALLPTLARCRVPEGWRVRVMVVDNGSTDGSAAAIAREFPGVELVALPENRRFAGGNNAGLRARARRRRRRGHAAQQRHRGRSRAVRAPAAGARAGPVRRRGGAAHLLRARRRDSIWYAGGRCVPALGLTRAPRPAPARPRPVPRGRGDRLPHRLLPARRAARPGSGSGLLDERYFIYAEDADWCLRARAAGFRLLFVPDRAAVAQGLGQLGRREPVEDLPAPARQPALFARHARGRRPADLAALRSSRSRRRWRRGCCCAGTRPRPRAVPRALWDAMLGRSPAEVKP